MKHFILLFEKKNIDVQREVDIFVWQRIFALQGFKCKKQFMRYVGNMASLDSSLEECLYHLYID